MSITLVVSFTFVPRIGVKSCPGAGISYPAESGTSGAFEKIAGRMALRLLIRSGFSELPRVLGACEDSCVCRESNSGVRKIVLSARFDADLSLRLGID